MMHAVVVVGSYVQDHAWLVDRFSVPGETRRAHGFNTGPGGKGFNQAIACHRQGVATLFVGAIGDDLLGENARRFAREEGMDCHWQVRGDVPTAASSIIVDASGQNQITVSLAANEYLDPAFLRQHRAALADAPVLLLQLENNLDAIRTALELVDGGRTLRVLNPAPVHPDCDRGLLSACDLITPNETEFALLLERTGAGRVDPLRVVELSDDALHAYCRALAVPTVVVTLGARGCFVSHGQDAPLAAGEPGCYRIAPLRVETVDSTGAGDAFSGALVAALVRLAGQPFRRMVEHANRSAALSTEIVGTAPAMPRFDEVLARFG